MQKMHRRSIGKENPDVLVPFPVEKPYFNNKPRTRCVQGLHLDILAGQSVAYPNSGRDDPERALFERIRERIKNQKI
jgi:hypothetical protein